MGYSKRTKDIASFSSLSVGWLVLLGIGPRVLNMLSKSSALRNIPSMGGKGEGNCIFYVPAKNGLGTLVHPR